MTPQKIKLTRHDGSDVCPVNPDAFVIVRHPDVESNNGDGYFYLADFAVDRAWKDVLAYAVIELVEPDPVIEVGDVVRDTDGDEGVVIGVHEGEAWVKYDRLNTTYIYPFTALTLVRKGGA